MFADDSNLFSSHRDIKTLFEVLNKELQHIHGLKQTNYYVFFTKSTKKDYIPLKLPNLHINK